MYTKKVVVVCCCCCVYVFSCLFPLKKKKKFFFFFFLGGGRGYCQCSAEMLVFNLILFIAKQLLNILIKSAGMHFC